MMISKIYFDKVIIVKSSAKDFSLLIFDSS